MPLEKQIEEMQRLLRACDEYYPAQIANGTITKELAEHRQDCYLAILDLLKQCQVTINSPYVGAPAMKFGVPKPPDSSPIGAEGVIAKSLQELITPKQISFIKALARELKIEPEEIANDFFKIQVSLTEISKQAASELIEYLKNRSLNAKNKGK